MITNPFEAKRPITTRPVLPASAVKRQPPMAALRFGSDSAKLTTSLPEWTKNVKDPIMTGPLFNEKLNELDKKYTPKKPNILSIFKIIPALFKVMPLLHKARRAQAKSKKYLPEEAKKDLRRYHLTPGYWFNRIFHSSKTKLMNIVYQGPLAIKLKQTEVTAISKEEANLKKALEDLKKPDPKRPMIKKFFNYLTKRSLENKLKELKTYSPLLNNVPPLPYSKFKKQLKELESNYNQTHTNDPIESIDSKVYRSGSMGQVYLAKTKSGKSLVMKMIKPNLTEKYLNGYLPYIYYNMMLKKGTTPQAKQLASQWAQDSVGILKKETSPEQEAFNTQKMSEWAQKLDPKSFNIPNVLAHTKDGLIIPFVGEKDFSELTTEEQVSLKNKIGPDLARFVLLSSAKPLDIHNGNMRAGKTEEPAQWIDHGRQFNISDENNKKMLHLMLEVFATPTSHHNLSPWENALLHKNVREKLKELLEINPSANKLAINSIGQIENIEDLEKLAGRKAELQSKLKYNEQSKEYKHTNKPELQPKLLSSAEESAINEELNKIKESLKPYDQTAKLLSQILGQPDTSILEHRFQRNRDKKQESKIYTSVLNAWASSALNLPGFTENALPIQDVQQYKAKMKGFMQPYLEDAGNSSTSTEEIWWKRRDEKIHTLAESLADALIKETNKTLDENTRKQLQQNISNGLKEDLLYS